VKPWLARSLQNKNAFSQDGDNVSKKELRVWETVSRKTILEHSKFLTMVSSCSNVFELHKGVFKKKNGLTQRSARGSGNRVTGCVEALPHCNVSPVRVARES
jgi:hypothetical protein